MLHPLRPDATILKNKMILLLPARSPSRERALTCKLFPAATLFTVDASEHDRAMASLMAVPRLVLLSLLESWRSLERFPSPASKMLLSLATSAVLADSLELFTEIVSLNPYSRRVAQRFLRTLRRMSMLSEKHS